MSRVIVSIFLIVVSALFLFFSYSLPEAHTGDPNQAKYFPVMISSFFLVISFMLLINELRNRQREENVELKMLFSKKTFPIILSIVILSIVYAFVFELLGFLVSTILFLGIVLFLINGIKGFKKWAINVIVAVLFSFLIWYGFGELLGISLP